MRTRSSHSLRLISALSVVLHSIGIFIVFIVAAKVISTRVNYREKNQESPSVTCIIDFCVCGFCASALPGLYGCDFKILRGRLGRVAFACDI